MEIKFDKHCYSEYIEKQVRKFAKDIVPKVLGRRAKVITTLRIKLQTRFDGHKWDDYNRMFDHGEAFITIYASWMSTISGRSYGVRHELTHLRDVMDGLLIGLPPEKNRTFKIKWRPTRDDAWTTYSRHIPDWLTDRVFDEQSYKVFLGMMAVAYPWEAEPLNVFGKDKVA